MSVSFGTYMRQRLGEMLLCFISAWSIAQVAFNAFYIDEVQHTAIVPLAIAVLLVALFAIAYKRSWLLPGGIAFAAVAAVGVLAACALSTNAGAPYADEAGSYLYFALVVVFSALLCFVFTRTLPGCLAWFVIVAFFCSAVQAFYGFDEYVFSIAASVCAIALAIYRNFQIGMLGAQRLGRASNLSAFASSAIAAAAACGVMLVVWFGIIAPMQPGVLEFKIITEYRQLPIIELQGIASQNPVFDTTMTSKNLVEGERYTTDDLKIDPDSQDTVDGKSLREQMQSLSGNTGSGNASASASGKTEKLNNNAEKNELNAMNYSIPFPAILATLLAILLLVVACIAYFVGRRRMRRERLIQMLNGPRKEQLGKVYLFCLQRMGKIGFAVPEGSTLTEFARNNERRFDTFTVESGVSFGDLTQSYVECIAYGERDITEDDIVAGAAFYEGFWRAAREYLGNFRYFWRSFRL